jgi:hypothetical protein
MGAKRRYIAIVLFAGAVSAHRRDVLQSKQRATRPRRPSQGRPRAGNGNNEGKVFNFKAHGGARAFLSKMDPGKLDRVMRMENKAFDGLVLQLDSDPDMVSPMLRCGWRCQ